MFELDEKCDECQRPAQFVATDFVIVIDESGKKKYEHSKRKGSIHHYCNWHKKPASEVKE